MAYCEKNQQHESCFAFISCQQAQYFLEKIILVYIIHHSKTPLEWHNFISTIFIFFKRWHHDTMLWCQFNQFNSKQFIQRIYIDKQKRCSGINGISYRVVTVILSQAFLYVQVVTWLKLMMAMDLKKPHETDMKDTAHPFNECTASFMSQAPTQRLRPSPAPI